MRRQGYKLYAALFALLLLAACSSQDSTWGDSGEASDRRPLAVSSLLVPAPSPLTRVTVSPLPADGEVGFFVLANAPHYSVVTNKKGIYKADENLWLPTDSIWLSRVAAKVALYYPYDAAQTTDGQLNLTATVRTDDTKDICCTRFEADSRAKGIRLTLNQLYSRLFITFVKTADVEYIGPSSLTALKLDGVGIYSTAAYNLADGAYTYGNAGYTATLNPAVTIKGTNADAADAAKVDLLLPPYQTLTQDITLTATVDTKEMKIVIPKIKLANTLTAGKQYNITVKLKPTALVLGSVQTTEWDSQTAFNEDAKMEGPPPHAIEVEGLDFYVADGNVRAIKQVDNTYKYAFAEEQGDYSGVEGQAYDPSGGDYFSWNTLDPAATTSSNTTDVWDTNSDPCRKIGDGQWYTPTQAQLKQLEDLHANGMTVWGRYTMKDGTTKEGRYFGTTMVPDKANQDKYVFLPAAGSRVYGSFGGVGSSGYYWSDTLYDVSTSVAYQLNFSSANCYVYYSDRGDGYSLRCSRDK